MAPIVDGPGSIDVYYECLDSCQRGLMDKRGVSHLVEDSGCVRVSAYLHSVSAHDLISSVPAPSMCEILVFIFAYRFACAYACESGIASFTLVQGPSL